ncbi:unnamed protein product [Closterium sp. NIES-65]|nr:unnamed protein product [Closterium sp. NIES-65]
MGKPRAKPRQKVVAKGRAQAIRRVSKQAARPSNVAQKQRPARGREARREPQPHGSQEQRHTTVAAGGGATRQDERQAEESAEEAEAAAAASKTRRKGEALEEGDAVAADTTDSNPGGAGDDASTNGGRGACTGGGCCWSCHFCQRFSLSCCLCRRRNMFGSPSPPRGGER